MPQMNKGGKFVFGESEVHSDGRMQLLSIRSSDIAFTMGAKGQLWEKAKHFDGEIPLF